MAKPVILLTGCGGVPAQNVVWSLQHSEDKYHIIGVESDKFNIALTEGFSQKYLVPAARDSRYSAIINQIAERENAELIHAQPDVEVGVLSEKREEIQTRLILPSKEAVKVCHDKYKFIKTLQKRGLPVAESFLLKNEDDLEIATKKLGSKIWVRAIRGVVGGRGSLPTENIQHAKMWIDYWNGWGTFVAEEYLPGRNLAWQGAYFEGKIIGSIAYERIRYIVSHVSPSGITGNISVGRIIDEEEVHKLARKTVETIDSKPTGVFGVDMKGNVDNVICVTEVNPGRFFAPCYMYASAGYNLVQMFFDVAFGEANPNDFEDKAHIPENLYWIRGIDTKPVVRKMDKFPVLGEPFQ